MEQLAQLQYIHKKIHKIYKIPHSFIHGMMNLATFDENDATWWNSNKMELEKN